MLEDLKIIQAMENGVVEMVWRTRPGDSGDVYGFFRYSRTKGPSLGSGMGDKLCGSLKILGGTLEVPDRIGIAIRRAAECFSGHHIPDGGEPDCPICQGTIEWPWFTLEELEQAYGK